MTANNLVLGFVLLVDVASALAVQKDSLTGQDDRALPPGVIARLGIPPPPGADQTTTMAFSRDGTLLACGGLRPKRRNDQGRRFPIQIFDGETGKWIRRLAGHAAPVFSLQFSRVGGLLVSAAGDGSVSVWNVDDGDRRWSRSLFDTCLVCFSHDAKHVFVTDTEDCVWVLESAAGNTLREANAAGEVKKVDDRNRQAGQMGLWETIEVTEVPGITTIRQRHPDGWVRTRIFYHASGGRSGASRGIHFLPDGMTMVSVSPDGRIQYRDVLTGKEQPDRAVQAPIVVLREQSRGSPRTVAVHLWPSTNEQSVSLARDDAVASMDKNAAKRLNMVFAWPPPPSWITGYSPFSGDRERADRLGRKASTSGEMSWMSDSIAFSRDGRLVALMGRRKANEYEIRIVDLRNDKTVGEFLLRNRALVREVNPYATAGRTMQPELKPVDAAFSPDGTRLAVAIQGEIRMCEVRAGQESLSKHVDPPTEPIVVEHQDRVDAVAFSPDGSLVATAGRDCMTRLWSARTGKELGRWLHDWKFGYECSVAFSPDGKLLAVDVGGQVDLIRCSDGQLLHQLALGAKGKRDPWCWPYTVAFSPDGRRLAVHRFNRRAMTWWDVRSGEKIGRTVLQVSDQDKPLYGRTDWPETEESGPAAFSPSLRWLGSTDFKNTVYFHWDTSTGEQAFKTDHRTGFTSVRFSPDERLLALGVPNQPIRIIDIRKGATVRELKGPPGFAYPRAFLDEGRILVSDHDDNSTRFWDVHSGQEVYRLRGHRIRACSQGGRYAASVCENVSPDPRAGPAIVSSTILIWDLRLLKEAARERNGLSGKRRPL